jgi:hypothetical protein
LTGKNKKMKEKEIVKLREILGRIARRSEHKPDLKLIKSLAIEADNLVKESDSLPCVSDFYLLKEGDIIREGDEFANCDGWSKTGVVNETYIESDFKPHRRRITNWR